MKKTLALLVCTLMVGLLGGMAAAASSEAPAAGPAPLELWAGDLFTPAPERMDPCIRCIGPIRTTSPGGGQASHWGKGSSCSAAEQDLNSQLTSATSAACAAEGALGSCQVSVVITAPCWWDGSQYVVDGYADYKCTENICL